MPLALKLHNYAFSIEITKVRDYARAFVSWSQKSRSGEIGQNFNIFLSI